MAGLQLALFLVQNKDAFGYRGKVKAAGKKCLLGAESTRSRFSSSPFRLCSLYVCVRVCVDF